jgi:hypothetical protein
LDSTVLYWVSQPAVDLTKSTDTSENSAFDSIVRASSNEITTEKPQI